MKKILSSAFLGLALALTSTSVLAMDPDILDLYNANPATRKQYLETWEAGKIDDGAGYKIHPYQYDAHLIGKEFDLQNPKKVPMSSLLFTALLERAGENTQTFFWYKGKPFKLRIKENSLKQLPPYITCLPDGGWSDDSPTWKEPGQQIRIVNRERYQQEYWGRYCKEYTTLCREKLEKKWGVSLASWWKNEAGHFMYGHLIFSITPNEDEVSVRLSTSPANCHS